MFVVRQHIKTLEVVSPRVQGVTLHLLWPWAREQTGNGKWKNEYVYFLASIVVYEGKGFYPIRLNEGWLCQSGDGQSDLGCPMLAKHMRACKTKRVDPRRWSWWPVRLQSTSSITAGFLCNLNIYFLRKANNFFLLLFSEMQLVTCSSTYSNDLHWQYWWYEVH